MNFCSKESHTYIGSNVFTSCQNPVSSTLNGFKSLKIILSIDWVILLCQSEFLSKLSLAFVNCFNIGCPLDSLSLLLLLSPLVDDAADYFLALPRFSMLCLFCKWRLRNDVNPSAITSFNSQSLHCALRPLLSLVKYYYRTCHADWWWPSATALRTARVQQPYNY